jgi:hypothetical protein
VRKSRRRCSRKAKLAKISAIHNFLEFEEEKVITKKWDNMRERRTARRKKAKQE